MSANTPENVNIIPCTFNRALTISWAIVWRFLAGWIPLFLAAIGFGFLSYRANWNWAVSAPLVTVLFLAGIAVLVIPTKMALTHQFHDFATRVLEQTGEYVSMWQSVYTVWWGVQWRMAVLSVPVTPVLIIALRIVDTATGTNLLVLYALMIGAWVLQQACAILWIFRFPYGSTRPVLVGLSAPGAQSASMAGPFSATPNTASDVLREQSAPLAVNFASIPAQRTRADKSHSTVLGADNVAKNFSKTNLTTVDATNACIQLQQRSEADDTFFALALEEAESGKAIRAMWARSIAEADGDEKKTMAAYIRLRVNQLRAENEKEKHVALEAERKKTKSDAEETRQRLARETRETHQRLAREAEEAHQRITREAVIAEMQRKESVIQCKDFTHASKEECIEQLRRAGFTVVDEGHRVLCGSTIGPTIIATLDGIFDLRSFSQSHLAVD